MKRALIIVAVLSCVLVGLIALRIRAQTRSEGGPASGSGVVEAEGIDLSARMSARVARVVAQEGQGVEAGALVLELECDEPKARLSEAEARLAVAKAQTAAAEAQALSVRGQSAAAHANLSVLAAQAEAIAEQKQLAIRESQRLESMGDHAALSARDRARSSMLGLEDQERAALASQQASRRQAAATNAQVNAALAQAKASEESVRALEALVQTATLLVRECSVRAPQAGVLERIYYEPGELVPLGGSVARLIDPKVATITFYVPSRDVDKAHVGGKSLIEVDSYPDQVFEGRITRVGLSAEFTPRNVQTRSDRDRLVFPVEVTVREHDGKLRTGMQVTASLTEMGR